MNHAITGDGTILEPAPTDRPTVILTADRPITDEQADAIRGGLAAALADADPAPPPAALQHQLTSAQRREEILVGALVRTQDLLADTRVELEDTKRALAVLIREWSNLRPAADPDGQIVDRAQRYGADLDAQAALERVRSWLDQDRTRMAELLGRGLRHITIGHHSELTRQLAELIHSQHNAPAGSPS